jgi:hypothetical protein
MPSAQVSLASLRKLDRDRRVLQQKEQKVAETQQRILNEVGKLLSGFGYRVVAMNGGGTRRNALRPRRRAVAKQRLKCAQCDRPFAYPMHLARHMRAMHQSPKSARGKAAKSSR